MKIMQLYFHAYFHVLQYHKANNVEYEFGCSGIKKFLKVFIFPGLIWNKSMSVKKMY